MHLDLKPTNVRVDAAGEPIVMDFGLARLTEIDYSEPPGMPAGAAGTPLYMAPEQIENRDDLDVRADVYSLGLLIYEVLVGRRAKGARLTPSQSAGGGSLDVVREVPPPPREVDPKVPSELDAITRRAIEVERDRRYQTAGALYEDLQNFRQDRLVDAKAHQPGYRLRKWMHQYREALAALGLIVIVMGLAVAHRTYLRKVTFDQWARVYKAQDVASQKAIERERTRIYELNSTRRELMNALEAIGFAAERLGDSALADESRVRAEQIRRLLGGDDLTQQPAPTQAATTQPADSSGDGPDPGTPPGDPPAGRER
jgi:serine/threonine-protein kinase